MAQTTKQIVLLEIIAYLALLIAALIYAFCREPNTYFAFLIQKLFQSNLYLYHSSHLSYSPYAWLIFSLPSGLWVMASTIIGGFISSEKKIWSFIPVFLVISIEILQFFGITDGVFDWLDVGVSITGFLVAQKCKIDVVSPKNRWYFAYGICILAVPLSDVM
jgi:hypothetical protein